MITISGQVGLSSNHTPSRLFERPGCDSISLDSNTYSSKLTNTAPPETSASSLASLSVGSASNILLDPLGYAVDSKGECDRPTRPAHRRENSEYFTAAWISPVSSAACSERSLSPTRDAGLVSAVDCHTSVSVDTPIESNSAFAKSRKHPRHNHDEDGDFSQRNSLEFTRERINQFPSDRPRTQWSNSLIEDDSSVDTQSVLSFRTAITQREEDRSKPLGLGKVTGIPTGVSSLNDASLGALHEKRPTTSEYITQWLSLNSQDIESQNCQPYTSDDGVLISGAADNSCPAVDDRDRLTVPMETTMTESGESQPLVTVQPKLNPSDRSTSAPIMKPLPPPPFSPEGDSQQHDEQNALSPSKASNVSLISKDQPTKGRSVSEASTPGPRRRLVWRKRTCFVSFPTEDPRINIMTEEEIKNRLAYWQSLGYSTKGWDLPGEHGGDSPDVPSLSRAPFPDPDECNREWKQNRSSRVCFPDKSQWEVYVRGLQEEKLRALGVGLGSSFSQSDNNAAKVSSPNQYGPLGQQFRVPSARIASRSSPLQPPAILGPHHAPYPPTLAGVTGHPKKSYTSLANHAPGPFAVPGGGGTRYVTAPTRKNTIGSPFYENDQTHPFPFNAPYQPQSLPQSLPLPLPPSLPRLSPSSPAFYQGSPSPGALERPTSAAHNMQPFNPFYLANDGHDANSVHHAPFGPSPGGFNIGEQPNQVRSIYPQDQLTPMPRVEPEPELSKGADAKSPLLSPSPRPNPHPSDSVDGKSQIGTNANGQSYDAGSDIDTNPSLDGTQQVNGPHLEGPDARSASGHGIVDSAEQPTSSSFAHNGGAGFNESIQDIPASQNGFAVSGNDPIAKPGYMPLGVAGPLTQSQYLATQPITPDYGQKPAVTVPPKRSKAIPIVRPPEHPASKNQEKKEDRTLKEIDNLPQQKNGKAANGTKNTKPNSQMEILGSSDKENHSDSENGSVIHVIPPNRSRAAGDESTIDIHRDSSDSDEIDAVMRQLNGQEQDDVGVLREKSPDVALRPKRDSPGAMNGPPRRKFYSGPQLHSTQTEPAQRRPERSKTTGTRRRPSLVQNLNTALINENEVISDWSDVIPPEEDEKFQKGSKLLGLRSNDGFTEIIDSRMNVLQHSMEAIQQGLVSIALKTEEREAGRRRHDSICIESDADDDADDEDEEEPSSNPPSKLFLASRKELSRNESLKQVVLEAIAAKEASPENAAKPALNLTEIHQAITDLKTLISTKRESDAERKAVENNEESTKSVAGELEKSDANGPKHPSDRENENAKSPKDRHQLQSLENMLRLADERADNESRMRRDAQQSLAECQQTLKLSEEAASAQRELISKLETQLIEIKESTLPDADNALREAAHLREAQENVKSTLTELSEKNISLIDKLEESSLDKDHWKAEAGKFKGANSELHHKIDNLKTQLQEGLEVQKGLRTKYSRLEGELISTAEGITKERTSWRLKHEELDFKFSALRSVCERESNARENLECELRKMNALKDSYEREVRLRERLESENADLAQQEKETAKLRFMFAQSHQENNKSEEAMMQLRQENQAYNNTIWRLTREKDDASSRCKRFEDELRDIKEHNKLEMDRHYGKMHDLKNKAWMEREGLERELSAAKASGKTQLERMLQDTKEKERIMQIEIERLRTELGEHKMSRDNDMAKFRRELDRMARAKQREIEELQRRLRELGSNARFEIERLKRVLNSLTTKKDARLTGVENERQALLTEVQHLQRELDGVYTAKAEKDLEVGRLTRSLEDEQNKVREAAKLVEAGDLQHIDININEIRSQYEERLTSLQGELVSLASSAKTEREELFAAMEESHASKSAILHEAEEQLSRALSDQRDSHERVLDELRERHARALHNVAEDKHRYELHFAEASALKDEKASNLMERNANLEDRVQYLEDKLSTTTASNGDHDSNNLNNAPTVSLSSVQANSSEALQESILVLQDQLQQREQRIEAIEQELASVDRNAPIKVKEKETEINWLRELFAVRLDDLNDIITALSQEVFEPAAVRDAAIRLQANLQMEQQDRERLISGGRKFPPPIETIKSFKTPSPRALSMAAAAAWGNLRKVASDKTSSSTGSPSRGVSGGLTFINGLLTPQTPTYPRASSALTESPEVSESGSVRRHRQRNGSIGSTQAGSPVASIRANDDDDNDDDYDEFQESSVNTTPTGASKALFKPSNYDHDAAATPLDDLYDQGLEQNQDHERGQGGEMESFEGDSGFHHDNETPSRPGDAQESSNVSKEEETKTSTSSDEVDSSGVRSPTPTIHDVATAEQGQTDIVEATSATPSSVIMGEKGKEADESSLSSNTDMDSGLAVDGADDQLVFGSL